MCSCGRQRFPDNLCYTTLIGTALVLPWMTLCPLLNFCKSAQYTLAMQQRGISSQQCPKVSIKLVCERREGRGECTVPPYPRTPMSSHSNFSPHYAARGKLRQGMKHLLVSSKGGLENSVWREQLGRWKIRYIKKLSPFKGSSNLPYFLLQPRESITIDLNTRESSLQTAYVQLLNSPLWNKKERS